MTPLDYTALCEATAARRLGAVGLALGAGMASRFATYEITTPLRIAHFVAQASHETEGFEYLTELGNAAYFARYDGRGDLGNTQPGDGARFKGRGLFDLSGRWNYQHYGRELGLDLVGNPDLAAQPATAVATACLFWTERHINPLADADDIEGVTRKINGGLLGLQDREAALGRAKAHLGIHP